MQRDQTGPPYDPHELVVDLQHVGAVESMLNELGVGHARIADSDRDERLGLARVRELREAGGTPLEVGEILALLRQRFAAERDGFQPVMGKNRTVDAVIGEGHKPMSGGLVSGAGHKPMAGAEPEPADPAELPPALMGSSAAGRGVRIGVVDTPPAPPSPGTQQDPLPFRAGHGAFVTSLVRRQAPAAEIHIEGVLDPDTGRADSWQTAQAMLKVAESGLDILNLSLGCYTLVGGPPLVIARALERLGPDVLVIAAAGNHGGLAHLANGRDRRSACWPAAVPPAVAVGAMDGDGNIPEWSPKLPWVSCLAPGVDIVGSYLTGFVRTSESVLRFDGHARWSGTSFAAATVTGAVAARTIVGSTTPRQALDELLSKGELIRRYPEGS